MADKKDSKSLYEIVFNQRDEEVQRLETIRSEIDAEIESAMQEFSKLSKKKKLRRVGKRSVTPLLLEGKAKRD